MTEVISLKKIPYLKRGKMLILLAFSLAVTTTVYLLPSILENFVLLKIVTVFFLVAGSTLALLFFLVNGGQSRIISGEYEKNYYENLKSGKADGEGENFRAFNPFRLTLAKRIYFAKLILCFLLPVILMFLFEYALILFESISG